MSFVFTVCVKFARFLISISFDSCVCFSFFLECNNNIVDFVCGLTTLRLNVSRWGHSVCVPSAVCANICNIPHIMRMQMASQICLLLVGSFLNSAYTNCTTHIGFARDVVDGAARGCLYLLCNFGYIKYSHCRILSSRSIFRFHFRNPLAVFVAFDVFFFVNAYVLQ